MESILSGLGPEHKFWLVIAALASATVLLSIAMFTRTSIDILKGRINYKEKDSINNEND